MSIARRRSLCLAVGMALLLAGCSKLPSVTGRVEFPDKTPLTRGVVIFDPADGNPYAAQGQIQPDGRFSLGTNRPGEGAHPGKYRVSIESYDETPLFDARFSNPKTSGLEFTVVPGSNDFTITVEKSKKKAKKN